jgi:exo-beta-1,3-glucanase (GH17 family)
MISIIDYLKIIRMLLWWKYSLLGMRRWSIYFLLRYDWRQGWISASTLLNKISSIKYQVQRYGYHGSVTTTESPSVFIQNPFLYQSSTLDIVGINVYSYFDPSSISSSYGSFVNDQISIIKNIYNGKSIFVTETGYPYKGMINGGNVPSFDNQRIALSSLFQAMKGYIIFFTFRDDIIPSDETNL